MEAFWKWLMRANARAVLAGAALALVAVLAWWFWKEMVPEEPSRWLSPSSAPTERSREPLGLLAYLNAQETRDRGDLPPDPFAYDTVSSRPSVPPPAPASTPVPSPSPPPPRPTPPPPSPPPPPKKPPLTLTYRGVMRRTDGTVLALLRDSRSNRAQFWPIGRPLQVAELLPNPQMVGMLADLNGVTLQEADERKVRLVDAEGRETVIEFGASIALENGRYVP